VSFQDPCVQPSKPVPCAWVCFARNVVPRETERHVRPILPVEPTSSSHPGAVREAHRRQLLRSCDLSLPWEFAESTTHNQLPPGQPRAPWQGLHHRWATRIQKGGGMWAGLSVSTEGLVVCSGIAISSKHLKYKVMPSLPPMPSGPARGTVLKAVQNTVPRTECGVPITLRDEQRLGSVLQPGKQSPFHVERELEPRPTTNATTTNENGACLVSSGFLVLDQAHK
jgi:hypothetical protein